MQPLDAPSEDMG
jgi:hypothetical protein